MFSDFLITARALQVNETVLIASEGYRRCRKKDAFFARNMLCLPTFMYVSIDKAEKAI